MVPFSSSEQTHPAVLPQRQALESVVADTPMSRHETGHGLPAAQSGTGTEHGRGEIGTCAFDTDRRHAEAALVTARAETAAGNGSTHHNRQGSTVASGAAVVAVLDKNGCPLMPCHPARARELLAKGRAVVARHTPFTIRLKDRTRAESTVIGVALRIDPGSVGTGIAVTTDAHTHDPGTEETRCARRGLYAVELVHRGSQIRKKMGQRANHRRRRRSANLRYRAPRFNNRARKEGWLPPSLQHRIDTTFGIASRLTRLFPVVEIHVERVAFDVHAMSAGRDLTGAEYQQGTLAGYEVREYLLEKWGRTCAYCGAKDIPLQVEHIHPRSRGGSDRITNLTLSCESCNQTKAATPVDVFLHGKPDLLRRVLSQVKTPLQGASVMNATRFQLTRTLAQLGVPVRPWSGGRTKCNRSRIGLAKTHTLDALAVGDLDSVTLVRFPSTVLVATATGRGSYARTRSDKYGFPRLLLPRQKRFFGYATGDLVRAVIRTGRYAGAHKGRIAVRSTGRHRLATPAGHIDTQYTNLRLLQRADGYSYATKDEADPVDVHSARSSSRRGDTPRRR
ncbi:RNA-guided endonuclease IscB [Streptomyces sp. A3M-1-3]|uniref:RNA-guided endonuclease IscB n=1 Tax=Streptomyces sp. A3M-1-3 TaxID=2962044 RepID=UPI0020B65BF3|nr:RNA-guided endonuclease IscB [Streptomyces sp. A3M-1-3]MCP3819591.1 RNA-guided endonuclease IscB [Streptomyces sp. A3M-1-3]